jgi:hypothetical protein
VSLTEEYMELLPKLREIAKSNGYALALHGSVKRDMDVIAVPWIEDVSNPYELWLALMEVSPFTPKEVIDRKKPLKAFHGVIKMPVPLSKEHYIDLAIVSPRRVKPTEEIGK